MQGKFVRAAIGALAICGLGGAVGPLGAPTVAGIRWTVSAPARPATPSHGRLIVRAGSGRLADAEAFVRRNGGHVDQELGIIDGFVATVPASNQVDLATSPAIVSVSDDSAVHPLGTDYTNVLGYDPATDTGSLYAIAKMTGARSMWSAGYTGKGVDVAVIDTGIARVPGLNGGGQVIDGPDLSFDSQSSATARLDGFGHGTMMAGIIAGNDAWGCMSPASCYGDPARFTGIAPDSRLVNVKVGAADGATDVSQVIAAIDWVVQHRTDSGLNIRVINLSYGTTSLQPFQIDPLAYAAEVAWRKGIVVVAAAGNDGDAGVQALSDPAYDPNIIAVGADDPMGTSNLSDDVVPDFASHGTMQRPVDVIAPGTHVVGLRVPGSFVDTYLSPGPTGTRFQRGSGTSESTAVVSGLAALMLQQHPDWTPDRIRYRLLAGATGLDLSAANTNLLSTHYNRAQALNYEGAGVTTVQPSDDASKAPRWLSATLFGQASSTGLGSLEAARGGADVVDDNGAAITGEIDIFGHAFNASSTAAAENSATSWSGGSWNGSRWSGSVWSGSRWSSTTWDGSRWSGSRWSGMVWDGSRWSSTNWDGSRWDGSRWDGSRWDGSRWDSALWG